jgi:hypothetical protein
MTVDQLVSSQKPGPQGPPGPSNPNASTLNGLTAQQIITQVEGGVTNAIGAFLSSADIETVTIAVEDGVCGTVTAACADGNDFLLSCRGVVDLTTGYLTEVKEIPGAGGVCQAGGCGFGEPAQWPRPRHAWSSSHAGCRGATIGLKACLGVKPGVKQEGRAAMARSDDVVRVQLATRIPKSLHRALRLHCVTAERSVRDFVVQALAEKLARAGSTPATRRGPTA